MHVDRYRWLGASRRQELTARLRADLEAWAREWCVPGVALAIEPIDDARGATAERWLRLESSRGSALLGAHGTALRRFGAAIAQAEGDDTLDWSGRVGRRALHALLARLLGADVAVHALLDATAPRERSLDPCFGGLALRLTGAGLQALVLLDAAACDARVAPAPFASTALTAVAAACAGETLTLDVVLPLGEANLADTHGLQVGDVLISDVSLATAFDLLHPDRRRLASAHLYRRDGQPVLQLEPA